ncbi:Spy/CpxP family protein refolding chaperone [Microbulbifer sp.]|uniref:Spy/CpxP family protein refolding chaperone n=1 Tax=Microbulbifer sp. TaxID=1908541 RepID=UPI0025909D0B|nr:Spy/CpxP family protein refolding chaperone [Microbulbifer sp.]
MKFWKAAAGCVAIVGLIAVLPVQADARVVPYLASEHSDGHKDRFEAFWEKVEEKLDLRKEQKRELKSYRDATKEERKTLKEESKKLKKQIKSALESGSDQSTLDKLGAQLGQLHIKRMELSHKYRKKFAEVLDDSQKAKLEKFKSDHSRKWNDDDSDDD